MNYLDITVAIISNGKHMMMFKNQIENNHYLLLQIVKAIFVKLKFRETKCPKNIILSKTT